MLDISCRMAQSSALAFEMDVSCITTQQIVYYPVYIPSSVRISGLVLLLCWLFASWSTTSALWRAVCEYWYQAGKSILWERWVLNMLPVGVGGVQGRVGVSSGVCCLGRLGGGTSVPLRLPHVWAFFAVNCLHRRQLDMLFRWSIAGCLCLAAFTFECTGSSTPRFISSRTLAPSF